MEGILGYHNCQERGEFYRYYFLISQIEAMT